MKTNNSKRVTITTDTAAAAYLESRNVTGLTTSERAGAIFVILSAACKRCGGAGHAGWRMDGGICYECNGAVTHGNTVAVSLIDYARKERARETAALRVVAKAAKRAEAKLDRQRDWCEANGHGSLTFEELDAKRAEARKAERSKSEHVGTEGKREIFTATVVHVASWSAAYGTQFAVIMRDENGNAIVWKTSNPFEVVADGGHGTRAAHTGDVITFKATVKAHDMRQGGKQTVVTRCAEVAA